VVLNIEHPSITHIQALLDWAKLCIERQADLRFQSSALEARILFTHVTGFDHAWMITHAKDKIENCLTPNERKYFTEVLAQRLSGKPIAYILGTQSFWSLNLKVSDCTLIPRQDTETLVETALSLSLPASAKVLDLGTGTGAIALALAKEKPQWRVSGVDSVQEAVALAQENAKLNRIDASFIQSDWFSALQKVNGDDHFDLIVTNPPYVEQNSEYVSQGDLRFEPLSALVSGQDGLDDIRLIIKQSTAYLHEFAYLLIEHGQQQSTKVQALLCEAGFTEVKSVDDLNGIPRVTMGRWLESAF